MKKRTICFFIIVIGLFSNFVFGAIPASERAALIAIYTGTNGDDWIHNTGWKTPPLNADGFAMPGTEGNWLGVVVSGDHVTELHFVFIGLAGPIPPELGNLSYLIDVNLGWNDLSGPIPSELGNLNNLIELNLEWNELTGPIPPELGNLSNLQTLNLTTNNLITGGIPSELGNLSNLRTLDLTDSRLSGVIPSQLGNLNNLRTLDLSYNRLTGSIPSELGNLSNLQTLKLVENQLTGSIPSELGNLSNLQTLNLVQNRLTGSIPSELGNLSNLQTLNLVQNRLTGSIPSELGNLSNLETLTLVQNGLSGNIPSQLGNLSNLQTLNLDDNELSGNIPSQLGNLNHLETLSLTANHLSGAIPSQLGNLSNLESLSISNNQLSGSLPPELGNLNHLKYISLGMNKLSGAIPPELGALINLESLSLGVNKLSGAIPPELGKLSNLKGFSFWENQLSGAIPPELGNLSNLEALSISNNQLSGAIPPELGNLRKLRYLFISDNPLSGVIPPELGKLSNLIMLILANNQLSGAIPPELGNLSNLGVLFLNHNQLIGPIPPELGNLGNLDSLNLAHNQLSGPIPRSIIYFSDTADCYIDYNCLYSTDPILRAWLSIHAPGWEAHQDQCGVAVTAPAVTTKSVSSITLTNAVCGGYVASDGGYSATSRGVCWNTKTNPDISNSKTTDGVGMGSFTANITGLNPGTTYYVRAYATNSLGTSYGVNRRFTTASSPGIPKIGLNRVTLNFGASTSGNATGPQTISISNTGGGTLNWSASRNDAWLFVSPSSGTGNGKFLVSVNPTGLTIGTHTGAITITDPNASNSPQTISVLLNIYDPEHTSKPFGEFTTPLDGSSVTNSIAVTGWALDDIGISNVKIYKGDTYISDAVFVEGARPDIESLYPTYPNNDKAGWGYLLLTNALPNGGNGSYTLTAKATDMEGNEVTLGSKTIIIDNTNEIKPFGAIDTPTQGGAASGKEFINFGWALTPQPNMIPIDGSTIGVIIDGVEKGHPVYNNFRVDIAELFPGYANTNGAGGYYYLDTTKLTTGVHTIAWNVTDNAGNTDGIGSRYFSVSNNPTSADSSISNDTYSLQNEAAPELEQRIEIKELERIQLPVAGHRLPVENEAQSVSSSLTLNTNTQSNPTPKTQNPKIEGYMVVGDQLRKLPIGSTLDKEKGIFYWQPGPGFVGEYRLIFFGKDADGQLIRKTIIVNIK